MNLQLTEREALALRAAVVRQLVELEEEVRRDPAAGRSSMATELGMLRELHDRLTELVDTKASVARLARAAAVPPADVARRA